MSDEELTAFLRDLPFLRAKQTADRIEQLINLNEALVELLDTARAEAKEAEAYAEGLEKEIELNEQEACMLENDLIKADKEIDDLKAKLAKAVEALEVIRDRQYYRMGPGITAQVIARATLATIEGSDAP
jgi:predicted RNase H-like nuclease (RuvC/YqgF family)